jgi:DNA-binding IscR family transcriptional regulator
MVALIDPKRGFNIGIRALVCVILSRNISAQMKDSGDVQNASNNQNLWQRISDETKTMVQQTTIQALMQTDAQTAKSLTKKICLICIET